MKRFTLAGLVVTISLAAALSVAAKPVTYELPEDKTAFKPGPNLDIVQGNCGACHSADYIAIQPRGPKFGKDFWKAEVVKMIKVYGAPIKEADVDPIADYLATNY